MRAMPVVEGVAGASFYCYFFKVMNAVRRLLTHCLIIIVGGRTVIVVHQIVARQNRAIIRSYLLTSFGVYLLSVQCPARLTACKG